MRKFTKKSFPERGEPQWTRQHKLLRNKSHSYCLLSQHFLICQALCKHFSMLSSNSRTILRGRFYHLYFTDEVTDALKSKNTWPKSHSQQATGRGSIPSSSNSDLSYFFGKSHYPKQKAGTLPDFESEAQQIRDQAGVTRKSFQLPHVFLLPSIWLKWWPTNP